MGGKEGLALLFGFPQIQKDEGGFVLFKRETSDCVGVAGREGWLGDVALKGKLLNAERRFRSSQKGKGDDRKNEDEIKKFFPFHPISLLQKYYDNLRVI